MSADTANKFNASIDFFELVVKCHIMAAAIHYFGMKYVCDSPTCNAFPTNVDTKLQWKHLQKAIGDIIDKFVIVQDFVKQMTCTSEPQTPRVGSPPTNPHADRVMKEHSYCKVAHERLMRGISIDVHATLHSECIKIMTKMNLCNLALVIEFHAKVTIPL